MRRYRLNIIFGFILRLHGEFRKHMIADMQEIRARAVAVTRQIYGDDGLDAAGIRGHDHDAVREHDGFIDIVRDEDDGLRLFTADGRDLVLQLHARERIQCGEGGSLTLDK